MIHLLDPSQVLEEAILPSADLRIHPHLHPGADVYTLGGKVVAPPGNTFNI